MSEPVAERALPLWQRWRCDLLSEEPVGDDPGRHDPGAAPPRTSGLGSGHPTLELRRSSDGCALVVAARAQARLDGHPGVVSIHSVRQAAGGQGEVRLGWAGTTLAGVLARRQSAKVVPCPAGAHRSSTPIEAAARLTPDSRLPNADLMIIGATVAAALDDAHRLRPPLVHGALDATAIRLDRWGRAKLDGFGAHRTDRRPPVPADDIHDLLVTLGDALAIRPSGSGWTAASRNRPASGLDAGDGPVRPDPAEALICSLLSSMTRRRPEVIDARDLSRAMEATAGQYSSAARRSLAATSLSGLCRSPTRHDRPDILTSSPHTEDSDRNERNSPDENDLTRDPVAGSQPEPGRALPGQLRPIARIGRGGHGDVWLAHDVALDRRVVVKQFHADVQPSPGATGFTHRVSASNPDAVEALDAKDDPGYPIAMERELAALSQLAGHTAAIECYRVVAGKRPALVLSWCSEGRLDPERCWSPTELAHLGAEVADALAVLHGRGLVHGDIKPDNLLRDRWGAVRLADFSLTSRCGSASPAECSPRHAPPEQLDGGPLSPEADLAALAATLFHLAEGRPPFDRGDGTEALVARRRSGAREAPPNSLRSLPGLAEWVLSWLEPDPDHRPAGGAAVAAAALRAASQPQGSATAVPGPGHRPRRWRGTASLLAIAVIGLIATVGSLAMSGSGRADVDLSRASTGVRPNRNADADAIRVAKLLAPADPLDGERPTGLALERRDDGSLVLIRTGDPQPSTPWVVRRDDYRMTKGMIDDQPSVSGLIGPSGAIDASVSPLRPGAQRAAVLTNTAGASCVRVVTARRPPEASAPLCWG